MAPFARVSEEEVFRGWLFSVGKVGLVDPDGTPFERFVVHHPGAVTIVPVDETRTVTLVRQYRASIDRMVLETPAGTCDVPGEAPETTARRELEEEVGVRAGTVRFLGTMLNSPGFCDQVTLLYLAQELEPVPPSRHGEEERYIEVVEIPLADIDTMIATGELIDAQTLLGLFLARAALGAT